MKALALILFIACTPTQRATTLAVASTALLSADWHQTRTGVTPLCQEQNPIIGPCGENVSPDIYFPAAIVAHVALGIVLPKHWRAVWFAAVAGAQGSTVWSNWRKSNPTF